MPIYNEIPNTAPLSEQEKLWCDKLEELLLSTPSRFGLYTTGNYYLGIFDKIACEKQGITQEDCLPSQHNLDLADIKVSEPIQGWCG